MPENCNGLGEYQGDPVVVKTPEQLAQEQEKILAERAKIKEIQERTGLKDYVSDDFSPQEQEILVGEKLPNCGEDTNLISSYQDVTNEEKTQETSGEGIQNIWNSFSHYIGLKK